jgi:soluble lytic murein transglycosylase-like protein
VNDQYNLLISIASKKYAVPSAWIKAVIATESSFNPNAYREEPKINDASRGLMQILLRTARGLGFTGVPVQLFEPDINIDLGTKLLAELRTRCGTNFDRVYSAYNSGGCDTFLTSAQVARNVERARGYLKIFEGEKKTPKEKKDQT